MNLGLGPTQGALRIKAPKQCVPAMSESGRPFGHVSDITGDDIATFLLSWPIPPIDAQVLTYLPVMAGVMSCEYTLVESSIAAYQQKNGHCLPEFRMESLIKAHEMPVFFSTGGAKREKQMCWYGQSNRSPMPYWLRIGDHHIVREASRVDMEVRTQKPCIPLIYIWVGTKWIPFGSVVDNSRLPSDPRRQDTTYLLSWHANTLHSHILIRFPPYSNGRACYYEFESARIGVKTPRSEPCGSEFTLTY